MKTFFHCIGLMVMCLPGLGAEPVMRTVRMLEGEHWWGLASGKGSEQPYTEKTDLRFDLFDTGYGNQTASFMVSDRGRALWCDEQVVATVRGR